MEFDHGALGGLLRALKGQELPQSDWPAVLEMANRTLVSPYMAAELLPGGGLPDEVRALLKELGDRTTERNRRLRAQLAEALKALNRANIPVILLKGSAYIAAADSRPGDRLFADLDFMVPHERANQAISSFEAIGYRVKHSRNDSWYGIDMARDTDVGGIDIHYRFRVSIPGYDFAKLADGSTQVDIQGAHALLPSPEMQVALFVIHDQLKERDYWRGLIDLRHLLDMQRIIDHDDAFDWARLTGFFSPGFPRRSFHTQVLTLQRLLGTRLPPAMEIDFRARLQLSRRLLQARLPQLSPLLTAMSILIDRPSGLRFSSGRPASGQDASQPKRLGWLRRFKRYFRSAKSNKIG